MCKGFTWKMQETYFSTDVMLISLGSCDMVLGVQWLSKLGPICWDFKQLLMQFKLDGKEVRLRGVPLQKLKVIEGEPSSKMLNNAAHLCLLQLKEVTQIGETRQLHSKDGNQETSKELARLKSKY